ncbi:hypothetical protein PI124_g10084 [Phytophthora idaei]|nr:hypothetical protein PI125_g16145 [Phytophthora idaei]KAG3144366.1 hypothetical protein PI126_g14208 [Phytophthora idaei]KAG3245174.1 hypothetical protein PI124_g10084 [Phytophthora idaei]
MATNFFTPDYADISSQSESGEGSSSLDSDISIDSESDDETAPASEGQSLRPRWLHVWSSMDHTDETYEVVKQSLLSSATAKNNSYKSTMKHALVG